MESSPAALSEVLQSQLTTGITKMKDRKWLLQQEVQKRTQTLKADEEVSQEITTKLKQNNDCETNVKNLVKTWELTLLQNDAESESQREEIDFHTFESDKLLQSFQKQSEELAEKIISAPDNYAMDKIVDEIEMYTQMADDISYQIQTKWDAEIETSKTFMVNDKPTTPLEVPDSPSAELAADALEVIMAKLKENIVDEKHTVDAFNQEDIALDREEDSLL